MTHGSFRLGLTCCFCGAAIEVDEASRCTKCHHCGAALKIARGESSPIYLIENSLSDREVRFLIERHLKAAEMQLVSRWIDLRRLHVPYWRVRGLSFCVRAKEVEPRYESEGDGPVYEPPPMPESSPLPEVAIVPKDVSFCADDSRDWGLESLGVRSQNVRLTPLSRRHFEKHTIIPPTVIRPEAIDRFRISVASLARASGKLLKEEVPVASVSTTMICFPLWVGRFVDRSGPHTVTFDPLSRRTVAIKDTDEDFSMLTRTAALGADSVSVFPHRCPQCGTDLPMRERSVTYVCANCHRVYRETAAGYDQLPIKLLRSGARGETLMPFWVFELEAGAKFQTLLNLLRCSDRVIFVPAFGISNPTRLIRLVSHYSAQSKKLEFDSTALDQYTLADVALSQEQASELIAPILWAMAVTKGLDSDPQVGQYAPSVSEGELIWLPFGEDGYFLREQVTGAAIEKASLVSWTPSRP
jgi:predicted RNA-binding Zn-ribbon protein involved in translation (DUF1610 family)